MGKIIYLKNNQKHKNNASTYNCKSLLEIEQELEEAKEKTIEQTEINFLYQELRNSTIEVLMANKNISKLDIENLTEAEKENIYCEGMKLLKKDRNYIKQLLGI